MQEHHSTPQVLDAYTKSSIAGAAKVAGIAAILSIAGTIISAIAVFITPEAAPVAKEGFENNPMLTPAAGTSVFSVIFSLLINGVLFFYLYRFSKTIRRALKSNQSNLLELGLTSLASYFRICAIIIVISMVFIFIAGLAVGMGAGLQ